MADFGVEVQFNVIHSADSYDFINAFNQCINQIDSVLLKKDSFEKIVGLSVFVACPSQNDVLVYKTTINNLVDNLFEYPVPVSLICQPPSQNIVSVEFISVKNVNAIDITYKNSDNVAYTVLSKNDDKLLFAFGLGGSNVVNSVVDQYETVFKQMKSILNKEGLSFQHVVRQWNYIENITQYSVYNEVKNQHYQIFNDIRSSYYSSSNFINGYPAATGIGTIGGGLCIDFIASYNISGIQLIKSPVQLDAHQYSDSVLENNVLVEGIQKSTPKFERAKMLQIGNNKFVFISGTAAILGQDTVNEMNVDYQTKLTIDNILALITPSNLLKYNIQTECKVPICRLLRAYVKRKDDAFIVEQICKSKFSNAAVNVVISDVCRDNLLVEIEGVFQI
jgi:enamine deaminase RidA (YjgF/YER057c/UK114 family)